MAEFQHRFDPTTLREYDIRGIVGKTLHGTDAFAIGRVFGSVVAAGGGRTVAVGYDGRISSPELELQLVAGLMASGAEVLRIGRGPDADAVFRRDHAAGRWRRHGDRQPQPGRL